MGLSEARAGFLRGRPDRRTPATLEEAGPAIELFHAHLDAGNFAEADAAFVGLENPKHRLLAPALEVGLLSRFFPTESSLATVMVGVRSLSLAGHRAGNARPFRRST
jgi:hypothetical protein